MSELLFMESFSFLPLASILHFFVNGGFFMFVLLSLSVFALSIIIWRGIALRYPILLPEKIGVAVEDLKPGMNLDPLLRAVKADAQNDSPLARVVRALLDHRNWPVAEAREVVQARARHEVARMEKGLVFLEITTGIAPLLGLLGTLSGLIGVFANLGDSGDPQLVALGIAEALNTTIMGLAVAAPSLIAYNYYMRKVEMIAVEMESTLGELIEKLYTEQNTALPPRKRA